MATDLPDVDETVVATATLLDAIGALTDDDVRVTSLLPGWTRAHVITHLARNADALVNVLRGARADELRTMYESQERRDADIEAGASRSAVELHDDVVAASGRWQQAANQVHAVDLDRPMARTPGAPTRPVRGVGTMRRIEVEVHHADLDIGYTAEDWPRDLVTALMERRQRELAEAGVAFRWRALDTGDTWETGAGPEVSGSAADIVWWLLGRGTGEALSCSAGRLPEIGRWT